MFTMFIEKLAAIVANLQLGYAWNNTSYSGFCNFITYMKYYEHHVEVLNCGAIVMLVAIIACLVIYYVGKGYLEEMYKEC